MSTAELIGAADELTAGSAEAPDRQPPTVVRLPLALAGALLALLLYSAFAHGAVSPPVEARIQVVIAGLAVVAGAGWLWTRALLLSAPRVAVLGAGLLGAFAIWNGVTLFWSVAPDQTWLELNRGLTYVILLCLAIAIGASHARAVEMVAKGFLFVALAVTAYALGQKLLPGVHVAGVFDLNQTGPLPRLQEPFGYWNALGLFVAMGVPITLALAVDRERSTRSRLAAACAIELMLLVIALTYSRGGILALVVASAVGVAVSAARLRSLMWLAVVGLATIPPLMLGLTYHSLTAADVPLASRESAGGLLALALIASLLVLVLVGRIVLRLERTLRVGPVRSRRIGRSLAGAAAVLLVAGVVAVALSSRGLDGTVTHAWKNFTATRATSNYDPNRLLSADSENRWVWWKEAAGAFSARPLAGWGAGSFGVVHLLYRRDTLTVQQPHSVPLQFLAETGIVGTLLALGGWALLLVGALTSVRRRAPGPQRLLAAGLLAGAVAYATHSLYDWDWDIPAMTFPAILFLGVLCGAWRPSARALDGSRRLLADTYAYRGGPGMRLAWLGAITLWLCTFALSATLPSLAASKAGSALVSAASSSPGALERARETAALASSLDPLSDTGLRAEATIAIHLGQAARARTDLLAAVRREPNDVQAWTQLGFVELLALRDRSGALRAFERAIALDPRGRLAAQPAKLSMLAAPPQDSATAARTP